MIDLHCHLLPGIDDGASNLAESIEMARELERLDYCGVCCTPHVPWGTELRTADELIPLRAQVQQAIEQAGLKLRLYSGAEHHVQCVAELLVGDQLLVYPRADCFLMEFSLQGFPARLDDLLFRIQVKGLRPVVAHVERYPEVQKDLSAVEALQSRGCSLLVNLTSLVGAWDRAAKKTAERLLGAGLVDAVTTDMHSVADGPSVEKGLSRLLELVGQAEVERLTQTRPAELSGLLEVTG